MIKAEDIRLAMPDVDFGADHLEDMATAIKQIEAEGDQIVRVRYRGDYAWLVLGYQNSVDLYRNEAEISAAHFFRREFNTLGTSLFHMEGAEHKAYKMAVGKRFAPSVVRAMVQPLLAPAADEIIDEFGDLREFEVYEHYARRYSFNIISRMLGIPVPREKEQDFMNMIGALNQIKEPGVSREEIRARADRAKQATNDLLQPLITERRAHPGEDLISYLVHLEVDGRTFDDIEVMDFARSIYLGGAETTPLQFSLVMNYILARPELRDRLIAHPEERMAAIDEIIRLASVVGINPRVTGEDTEILGTVIPKGKFLLLCQPAANLSEKAFPEPEAFKPDRPSRTPSLTFGAGVRLCLGKHLAREELRILLGRVLDRLEGIRFAKPPAVPIGNLNLVIPGGVWAAFDKILPAPAD